MARDSANSTGESRRLRAYQTKAVRQILEYREAHPKGRLLVVLPPGGGKTAIMAAVLRKIVAQGHRALTWAHRRELIGQHYDHLRSWGIPARMIGVIMAGDPRADARADIQVASVQTLAHRDLPAASVVASDEAHRDASDGRRKLRGLYPDAFHVGFTGTPCRLDGRGLGDDYDEMIVVAQPSDLIRQGYLVAPRIFTVPDELLPDLSKVRTQAGEFEPAGLELAANQRVIIGGIVDHWKRLAENRRTMVFPVSIAHSKSIVERFRKARIPAAHLDGESPDRTEILAALRDGSIRVVSSCGVLSEGVDIPEVKCVIEARPTKSLSLHIQQGGRCMRPWQNETALILDHAGNAVRLGSPSDDRPWSLSVERRPSSGTCGKACSKCGAIVPIGFVACSNCNEYFPVDERPIEVDERKGELAEYRKVYSEAEANAEWARILAFANKRSFPEEWARRVYENKVGEARS